MKLDRALQKQLLEQIAEVYPEQKTIKTERVNGDPVTVNLCYLEEHGLIKTIKSQGINTPTCILGATITHRGLDFLAEDGGLTAILGTVIVKLHADTLRDIIEAKISASDMPEDDKKQLIEHIQELPAEALKTGTMHLLEQALDHLPDALQILQGLCGL